MYSNSAGVGTQSSFFPRRLMVISKFTCVVVPTVGITSTSTSCPRSVIVKVRGRVPMNVARDRSSTAAVFLLRGFELLRRRPVFTTKLMDQVCYDCQLCWG